MSSSSSTTFFADVNGDAYDPYALAWRYLGMYVDCTCSKEEEEEEGEAREEAAGRSGNGGRRKERRRNDRRLSSGSRDDEDEDGCSCSRELLWAVYADLRYEGDEIGEYQFFDWSEMSWDDSTCSVRGGTNGEESRTRCARMDCHETFGHFKLVGVYREKDGLYDWASQLFKHQGYCLWNDEDMYEAMEDQLERWPQQCTELSLPDFNGDTLYYDIKPLPEGNITIGLYYDQQCTFQSFMTWSEYIRYYYKSYGYTYKGESIAEAWQQAIGGWNEYMTVFKVCQPCRAYNLHPEQASYEESGSGDRGGDRILGGSNDNSNDGEGGEGKWGYDCYDDAGYTNADQCYKFVTQTSMEEARAEHLSAASSQGTILSVRVNGRTYGAGTFRSTRWWTFPTIQNLSASTLRDMMLATVCIMFAAVCILSRYKQRKKNNKAKTGTSPTGFSIRNLRDAYWKRRRSRKREKQRMKGILEDADSRPPSKRVAVSSRAPNDGIEISNIIHAGGGDDDAVTAGTVASENDPVPSTSYDLMNGDDVSPGASNDSNEISNIIHGGGGDNDAATVSNSASRNDLAPSTGYDLMSSDGRDENGEQTTVDPPCTLRNTHQYTV